MKKLIFGAAMAVALLASPLRSSAENINIGNGTYNFTREVDRQVAPGVQYTYFKCSSRGTYGTHVFVTTVDLTNPNVKIEYLTAGGTMGGATKSLATIAANSTTTNHKVVAGANANFWITSEQPWRSQLSLYPHGTAVSNGVQYSINPPKGSNAHMGGPTNTGSIVIGNDGRAYIKRFLYHYFIYHPRINHMLDLTDCNRVVEAGTASIYTRAYGTSKAFKPVNGTSSNTWAIASGTCTEVICDLAAGQSAKPIGDVRYVIKEVRTNAGTGTLGNHDLAIVGRDSYATVLAAHYQVGDEIVLQQHCNSLDGQTADIIPSMNQATSGNCVTMEAGTIIDDAYIQSQAGYNNKVYARTLYGTNNDGTKLWIAVCGNKTSTYYGMTSKQMTYFLKYLGATYASQVDCGGSSQMYVDGSQVNKSTDGGDVRKVHSGIFVVSTSTGTTNPPGLTTTAANTNFGEIAVGGSASKSFTVTGTNLTGDITMSITGANANQFVVTPSTILKANQKGTITVKYAPTSTGSHTATLNIATSGVTTKTFTLTGSGKAVANASAIYQDDAAAYGVSASSSYTLEREYQDLAIAELAGKTIKRVIARGDILYILAHDAAKTPTIVEFNHVTKQVVRTLGTENATIGTPRVSDIAITADGFLVGQGYATQAFNGEGMGLTYRWIKGDDGLPYGQPFHWNIHNNSGNYTNGLIGETLVMQGPLNTGKFINTAQTASGSDVRFTIQQLGTVNVEGQIKVIWYNNLNKVDGYTKTDLGDMLLFASPYNENNVILQGNKKAGAEFSLSGTAAGVPTKVADVPSIIPAVANHTGIFRFGGKIYMTSPTFSGSNNNGVMLVDITSGLANGSQVSLSKSDMTSAATTNVATVGTGQITMDGGKFVEARLAILAVRNGSVTKFITPSTISAPVVEDPEIISNISGSVAFGEVKVGQSSVKSYNVEGQNLKGNITISVSGEGFSVSPATIAQADAQGTFDVTFAPASAGSKTGTLTISTDGAQPITVTLTGLGAVDERPVGEGEIENLTEVWNISDGSSTLANQWFDFKTNQLRSLAVNGDELYALQASTTAASNAIKVIDAKTGKDTGRTLDMTGVSGGIWPVSHIEMLGSSLYGSSCSGANGTLKVYRWKSSTSAPETVLTYTVPAEWTRLGEILSVWGDETDGRLMVCFIDHLAVFTVKNGVVNATPTLITFTKTLGGQNSTNGVVYNGDDTYTVITKDNLPTRIDSNGNVLEAMPAIALTNKYGTDAKVFDYGSKRYMAATAYKTGSITGGVLDLTDVTDGLSKAVLKFSQPNAADGLGSTSNNQFVTDVDVQILDEGKTVNLWVLVPFQGVAMYTYSTATPVVPVDPEVYGDRGHHAYGLRSEHPAHNESVILHFNLTGDVKNVKLHLYDREELKARSGRANVVSRNGIEPMFTFDLGERKAGANTYELPFGHIGKSAYDWTVEVESYPVVASGNVLHYAPAKVNVTKPGVAGGVAVITDHSDPSYGKIIVSNGYAQGFMIFSPDHEYEGTYCANTATWNASNPSSTFRMAKRDNGLVYAIDYSDAGAGVWCFNPNKPEAGTYNIFSGTKDAGGCWTLNGVAIGGGGSGLAFTGTGEDTKLWMFQEDYPNGNSGTDILCRYDIGTSTTITGAPTTFAGLSKSKYLGNVNVNITPDEGHGLFLSQNRNGSNTTGTPCFMYVDLNGNVLYNSGNDATLNNNCSGGLALSADRSLLAVAHNNAGIGVYDVTWDANGVPSFTKREIIAGSENCPARQLAFDNANNVVAYVQSADAEKAGLNVYAIKHNKPLASTHALDEYFINATTTGVEDIVADGEEATPVYYDIRGVRMPDEKALTPGIYIKVTGSKVEKVTVK